MVRCASARQPRRCGDRRLSGLDAMAAPEEIDAAPSGSSLAIMNREKQARSWHLRLLGGMQRGGHWQVPADTVAISLVGGVDLDLTDAEISTPEVTITKVSLVGGVRLLVPPQMNVVVTGFNLVGGTHVEPGVSADGAPTLRINAFGIFGGVDARRSG